MTMVISETYNAASGTKHLKLHSMKSNQSNIELLMFDIETKNNNLDKVKSKIYQPQYALSTWYKLRYPTHK